MKKLLKITLALMMALGLQLTSLNAVNALNSDLSKAGTYQIPVENLKSAAPLPAVQKAFAGAFSDTLEVTVDQDGKMQAVATLQNMIINMGSEYYANVLTIANGTTLSTKVEKSTQGMGGETLEVEVPEKISFELPQLDENNSTVLSITVDFMNYFMGQGKDYPTNVTLTLDLDNAKELQKEYVLEDGTYDVPVNVLKEKYETILALDDVIGLSISTRPDCLEDDVVEYLGELNKRTNLWVELGLQTIHDSTSKLINRGHDYDEFLKGLEKLKAKNIKVIVHIINGLPGEDYNMMMETAKAVANMGVDGIKIHLLHVIKDTPMEKMLQKGMLTLMNQEEYINLVCDQLEILPETMIVHRLTGDGKRDELVGPLWSLKKWEVLNAIDDELKKRNSYQGIKYNK